MPEYIFIMLNTWISFTGQMYDIPFQYLDPMHFKSRVSCEQQLKHIFAGEDNHKLETIKTSNGEIVLRVAATTSNGNAFLTCVKVKIS